ncbi:hypothetical protein D3C85_1112320 [compost metagenome]
MPSCFNKLLTTNCKLLTGDCLIHSWLNHFAFSKSNFAPALLILSTEKLAFNSSNEKISLSVPSFQPNTPKRFTKASGIKPSSLNPLVTSPVLGSVQFIA